MKSNKMMIAKLFIAFFILTLHFSSIQGGSFDSNPVLENKLPLYRGFRNIMYRLLGRNSENTRNLQQAKKLRKLQDVIPPDVPFPCNVTGFRSLKRPSSVHKLRPGDIDIIGALGDSLTAGFGLVATKLLDVLMENRGLSWSIGGQGTWRQYLTLPNILKEFNPNLFGYSLGDSYTTQRDSQFNPAEGAAISSEIPYMAKVLIKRITRDRRVNLKKDWKLITLMIGANDFCIEICYKNNYTAVLENHRKDMIEALRLIRDNLPRTLVNFVTAPYLKPILDAKGIPNTCHPWRELECSCLLSNLYASKRDSIYELNKLWQQVDKEVTSMSEFHQDDFEVVYQPTIANVEIPKISPTQTDFSQLSADCFHLSQRADAAAANALWNNMLERIESKSTVLTLPFEKFLCPTEENPYIFTTMNS